MFDDTENLDALLKILRNSSFFAIILQFLVPQSRKYYYNIKHMPSSFVFWNTPRYIQ